MKKFLLVSALMCVIVGTAASTATSTPLLVSGAGASAVSGEVVLNARATGPGTPPLFPVYPAVGFLRAPAVVPYFGPSGVSGTVDLSGRVTCIGVWTGLRAVSVSGTLNTPIFAPGGIVHNFTVLLVGSSQAGRGSIQAWALGQLSPFDPCGTLLFFSAGQELADVRANSLVSQGHFNIMGTP